MAIVALNTIKNWFKTDLKPTQQQFWDTWDSFRHKSEKVPIEDVEGINELLQTKASTAQLNAHIADVNAHPELLKIARIIPEGELLVFKRNGNTRNGDIELGDFVKGIVEGVYIEGLYNGEASLESFTIINQIDFNEL